MVVLLIFAVEYSMEMHRAHSGVLDAGDADVKWLLTVVLGTTPKIGIN